LGFGDVDFERSGGVLSHERREWSRGDAAALPLGLTAIQALPLYGLRRLYVGAVAGWYRLTDGGL